MKTLDPDPDSLEMTDPDLDPDSVNPDPQYLVRVGNTAHTGELRAGGSGPTRSAYYCPPPPERMGTRSHIQNQVWWLLLMDGSPHAQSNRNQDFVSGIQIRIVDTDSIRSVDPDQKRRTKVE